jgi:hypothetical protein
MPQLTLAGVYRVPVSAEVRSRILKHLGDAAETDAELKDLAHIDFVVSGADSSFSLMGFGQHSTGQAAWQDQYFDGLSYDGPCRREMVVGHLSEFRVCYFLHYFRPTEAIVTPYGDFFTTRIEDPPPALVRSHPYDYPWP